MDNAMTVSSAARQLCREAEAVRQLKNGDGDYLMKSGEAAAHLFVSAQTLRKMEGRGYLIPQQTYPSGHRRYSRKQIDEFLEIMGDPGSFELTRRDYMSSREVCRYCGFSVGLLNTLEREGILKPRRRYPVGRNRLWLRADVEKFANSISNRVG